MPHDPRTIHFELSISTAIGELKQERKITADVAVATALEHKAVLPMAIEAMSAHLEAKLKELQDRIATAGPAETPTKS